MFTRCWVWSCFLTFPGMLLASSTMLKGRNVWILLHLTSPSFCVKESRHCQPPTGSPRRPLRNIHPCAYDAYGMTCVEAAACAVASAMGEGVGAKALLEDATLTLQMPKEVGWHDWQLPWWNGVGVGAFFEIWNPWVDDDLWIHFLLYKWVFKCFWLNSEWCELVCFWLKIEQMDEMIQ